MGTKVAVVTGGTGLQGEPLLRLLGDNESFNTVYAFSRRPLPAYKKVTSVQTDLRNADQLAKQLKSSGVQNVTHIFHLAFSGDVSNRSKGEADMLRHLIDGLEATGSKLEHVYFTSGGKHYGVHLGQPKIPLDERDSRHMPPNFYYDLEDLLIEKVDQGASWSWSTLRPMPVIGISLGGTMNLLQGIAGFGVFCKELGVDMRFPGPPDTYYKLLFDVADVDLLMEAAIFTSTEYRAKNHAFNISNGDVFTWSEVWPKIAAWFGLSAGPPLPLKLAAAMADKESHWKDIQKKYNLDQSASFQDLFVWDFPDACLNAPFSMVMNVNKLRQAGFNGQKLDTAGMFISKLNELAERKLIPRYIEKAVVPSLLEQSF